MFYAVCPGSEKLIPNTSFWYVDQSEANAEAISQASASGGTYYVLEVDFKAVFKATSVTSVNTEVIDGIQS